MQGFSKDRATSHFRGQSAVFPFLSYKNVRSRPSVLQKCSFVIAIGLEDGRTSAVESESLASVAPSREVRVGRPDGRLPGGRGGAFPIFGVAFPLKQRPSFDSLHAIGSLGKALSVLPFCQDSIKRNTALFSRESVSVRLRGKRKEEYVNIEGSGHIDDAPPGYCRCAARKMVAFLFPLRTDDAGVSAGAFSDS